MLAYHRRETTKERDLAERALELFLTAYNLRWSEAYHAAAFERAEGVERLASVLEIVAKGKANFYQAVICCMPEDPRLPEARPL